MEHAQLEQTGATARTIHGREVWAFLRGGAPWALAAAALLGGGAFLQARVAPDVYQADLALLVSTPRTSYGAVPVVAPPNLAPGAYRSALVDGGIVIAAFERVLQRELSDAEAERLGRTVRVSFEDQEVSSVVRVQVRHGSAQVAADVANAVADGLVAWDLARAEAVLAAAPEAAVGAVVVPAIAPLRTVEAPELPIAPRPVFATAVALALGLLAGYAGWLLRVVAGRRPVDGDALADLTGLPLLAAFPPRRRGAEGAFEDAAAVLRARLADGDGRVPGVLLVTAAREGADKAGVAFALAEGLTRWGRDVLLVDADVRHADATAALFGGAAGEGGGRGPSRPPPPGPGGERPIDVALAGGRGYAFVAASPRRHAAADAAARALVERLPEWAGRHDVVVLDAAPVAPFADALALAGRADAVVLCARHGATRRAEVLAALAALRAQQARLAGVVWTEDPAAAAAFRRAQRAPRPRRR